MLNLVFAAVLLVLSWISANSFSNVGLHPRGGLFSDPMQGSRPHTTLYMAKERNFNTFVKVKSNFEAQTILEHDEGCSLNDYMRLPVDQYVCIKMPLDAKLQRLNSNFFNLTVPPVTFFNLQVSPTVQCIVSQTQDAVVIESESVYLGGSPVVESLNGCFKIRIQTIFNWVDRKDYKSILSRSSIDVDVDPPAPFKYFGKRVLETTGTLAMSIALRQIENAFVTNLGDDFSRWAKDGDYRMTRAGGACEVPEDGSGGHSERGASAGGSGTAVESSQAGGTDAGSSTEDGSVLESSTARGTGLKSELPAVNIARKLSFPEVESAEEEQEYAEEPVLVEPVALRDIPVRQKNNPRGEGIAFDRDTWEEEQIEERKREKAAAKTLNAGVDDPNPGITIPFKSVADDETPASLLDDVCLVPGEAIVRVEEAPDNARRIFTGIDISADVEDVWAVLTDYENLGKVIPSLVKNDVLERRPSGGARLSQVGGAKILPGITFTAKTVLDVEIYREDTPIPLEMTADHLPDAPTPTAGDKEIRDFDRTLPLQRGVFPRPYALTQLKHRDITMQNVEGMGDFEHYQGIWRLQRLPNCAPDGGDACRLTYAVELRPKGFLPVGLIEGRIAGDLKNNLDAIRRYVQTRADSGLAAMSVDGGGDGGGRGGVSARPGADAATIAAESSSTSSSSESSESSASAAAAAVGVSVSGQGLGQGVGPGEDRVGLDAVLAAIKLAQINEISLRGGGGAGVLSVAATSATISTGTATGDQGGLSLSTDSGGGVEGIAAAAAAGDLTGDEISPKKWSYRRLLVTGSGFARSDLGTLLERNRELGAEVSSLERELGEAEQTIETIGRIVPGEFASPALVSSARLARIKRAMSEYSAAGEDGDGTRGERTAGSEGEGEGEGDIISKKKWSYRRLLVTGSGYIKSDRRNYARENRDLEARREALKTRLSARKALLSKITQMSEPSEDGVVE